MFSPKKFNMLVWDKDIVFQGMEEKIMIFFFPVVFGCIVACSDIPVWVS